MQALPQQAGVLRENPNAVAALLDWWRLAGVDVPVADTPVPWLQPRAVAPPVGAATPAARQPRPAAEPRSEDAEDWAGIASLADLAARVRATHLNAPFADGNPASGLMIVGEAPSAEDLLTGRPFSGPAGQFLDRMLAAIGIDRGSAYIALLAPRRGIAGTPPAEAIARDLPLARAHIRLAAPRLLLLLGANPVQALAETREPIGRVRGRWLDVDAGSGPIPALAGFNPAYLLRRPEDKALAWSDLLALKRRLAR